MIRRIIAIIERETENEKRQQISLKRRAAVRIL